MKIVVLDSFPADQGEDLWQGLRALGSVEIHPRTAPGELGARAAGATALLTNKVVLDAAAIGALPDLGYVGVVATGTNVVDLGACRDRGIAVTNVPGYSTDSVAQLVLALLLAFTHRVERHSGAVKAGAWAACPDFMFTLGPVVELRGKTLGVVGLGAIGRRVAALAEALGMRVLAARVPGSDTPGRTPLHEALAGSDFVSLHCPLTPMTRGLVSDDFLAAMRPGAVLVNTGRGDLVDEAALRRALASGRLGGAALDVLTREPPRADDPLLDPGAPWADRLLVTPHLGWATVEARARLVREVTENLAAYLRGEARNRVER